MTSLNTLLTFAILALLASAGEGSAKELGNGDRTCWPATSATAPESSPVAVDVADLQEQLETGLRARRPEEFAFLARVVQFVEQGQLPLKLVKETFLWARERDRYPYPYFERAIKIRAARIGVQL